jgi:hypothetical protein
LIAVLLDLQRFGIVQAVTGHSRGLVIGYRAYLDILNEGTAPLASPNFTFDNGF